MNSLLVLKNKHISRLYEAKHNKETIGARREYCEIARPLSHHLRVKNVSQTNEIA